jgi:zinc protease
MHFVWHSPASLAEGDLELDVAAAALGSGGWGRLTKRLVDDEKIAQSVWVYQSGSGFSGTFDVVVTLAPGQADPDAQRADVTRAIQEEIDKLIAEGPTASELSRHVIGVESGFVWGLEDLGGRANQLQWFNHYTGEPGYAGPYVERIRGITPAAVKAAAAKWLSKPHAEIISIPAPPEQAGAKKPGAKPGAKPAQKPASQAAPKGAKQ